MIVDDIVGLDVGSELFSMEFDRCLNSDACSSASSL